MNEFFPHCAFRDVCVGVEETREATKWARWNFFETEQLFLYVRLRYRNSLKRTLWDTVKGTQCQPCPCYCWHGIGAPPPPKLHPLGVKQVHAWKSIIKSIQLNGTKSCQQLPYHSLVIKWIIKALCILWYNTSSFPLCYASIAIVWKGLETDMTS